MRDLFISIKSNKISYVFLFIGMFLTMIIISIALGKSTELYLRSKDVVDQQGIYKYVLNIDSSEELNIDNIVEIIEKNITTFNVEVPIITLLLKGYNTQSINFMVDNGALNSFPKLEGSSNNENNICIVGKEIGRIGDYINIGKEKFEVVEVLGRKNISSIYDNSIYIDLKDIPDILKEDMEHSIGVILKSIKPGNTDEIDKTISEIVSIYPNVQIIVKEDKSTLNEGKLYLGYMNDELGRATKVLLVALINNILISYFVIITRKKEVAIRKVWGATNIEILLQVIIEFLVVNLFACLLAMLVQVVAKNLFISYFEITMNFNIILFGIILTVVTTLLTIIIPILKGINNTPISILKE